VRPHSHRHDRPVPHPAHRQAARPEHTVPLSRTVTKNVSRGKHHGWASRTGVAVRASHRPHASRGSSLEDDIVVQNAIVEADQRPPSLVGDDGLFIIISRECADSIESVEEGHRHELRLVINAPPQETAAAETGDLAECRQHFLAVVLVVLVSVVRSVHPRRIRAITCFTSLPPRELGGVHPCQNAPLAADVRVCHARSSPHTAAGSRHAGLGVLVEETRGRVVGDE
jgi:hypothetical protein